MATTAVDSGALRLALNVLRRSGKTEVADALEATAVRLEDNKVKTLLYGAGSGEPGSRQRVSSADIECAQCCSMEGEPCRNPKTGRYFKDGTYHESRAVLITPPEARSHECQALPDSRFVVTENYSLGAGNWETFGDFLSNRD